MPQSIQVSRSIRPQTPSTAIFRPAETPSGSFRIAENPSPSLTTVRPPKIEGFQTVKYFNSQENNGAGNGVRTRDPKLGKLVLYQLSYARSFRADFTAAPLNFLAQAVPKVKFF